MSELHHGLVAVTSSFAWGGVMASEQKRKSDVSIEVQNVGNASMAF